MIVYYGLCTAILGLLFGSFLNGTAMRVVRKEDFVKGRSHCMSCGHELSAIDLVPVFSYMLNKGRCRYCKAKVSARYPITELSFMGLSIILYIFIAISGHGDRTILGTTITVEALLKFLKYWFFTGCLFVVALTDIESFEIPDGALIIGLIGWIIFTAIETVLGLHDIMWVLHHILAGIAVGAVMLGMSLLMDKVLGKDSLGGGDIKLYALLGVYLGYAGAYELIILSCILGLAFAGIRRTLSPDASKEFPFGPSIAAAGYILLICGNGITEWYLSLFI